MYRPPRRTVNRMKFAFPLRRSTASAMRLHFVRHDRDPCGQTMKKERRAEVLKSGEER
jgi:hypothetical protein